MRRASALASVSFVALVSLVRPPEVGAQSADMVGVRALGMGGAFTAVADDATATWWNPAGLAGGAFFSAIIEYAHPIDRPGEGLRAVSLGFPALGISYYRVPTTELRPSIATVGPVGSREDEGSLSVFSATVGQSIGNHLVLGSTVKVLNALEDTEGGLDLGAMVMFGKMRAGLMVRNVTEPEFGSGAVVRKARRTARAGAAFTTGTRGAIGDATFAFDADLVKTPTVRGEERRMAAGGEFWMFTRRVGLRGGISASTIDERRWTPSGGVSAAIRQGTFVDAEFTDGEADEGRRGWAIALRVTF